MKLIDNQNRKVLSEGRQYQMGFAFCKKLDANTFETVHPISPCKDYLNDVFYSEFTGKDMCAYGLNYKQQNIFVGKRRAFMAIKICASYLNFDKDNENFNKNYLNAQKFINNFEKILKITPSVIKKVDDSDTYIVSFSKNWLVGVYSISLFALLLRLSQWYDGEKDVKEYIKTFNYFDQDIYMAQDLLKKLDVILEKGLKKEKLSKYDGQSPYTIHNNGILSVDYDALDGDELPVPAEEEDDDFDDDFDDED